MFRTSYIYHVMYHIPRCYITEYYCGPLSDVVRPLIGGERSAPLWQPTWLCYSVAGPGGTFLILITAPLTRSATGTFCARWGTRRSNSSSSISIVFDEKNLSSSKAITQAFNRQFTIYSVPDDRILRRLMGEVHHHHLVRWPSTIFHSKRETSQRLWERRVLTQSRDLIGSPCSTCIAFLTELFNLSVDRLNFTFLAPIIANLWRDGLSEQSPKIMGATLDPTSPSAPMPAISGSSMSRKH